MTPPPVQALTHDKPAGGVSGPCAKAQVFCEIVTLGGSTFVGTNWCANPQSVCPRAPGEGYEKCKSICQQSGHAEIDALRLAGDKAKGATATLRGHTYMCQSCQEALYAAGVAWVRVVT